MYKHLNVFVLASLKNKPSIYTNKTVIKYAYNGIIFYSILFFYCMALHTAMGTGKLPLLVIQADVFRENLHSWWAI